MNQSQIIGVIAQLRIQEKQFSENREMMLRKAESDMLAVVDAANKETATGSQSLLKKGEFEMNSPNLLLGEFGVCVITITTSPVAITNYSRLFVQGKDDIWYEAEQTKDVYNPLSDMELKIICSVCEQIASRRPSVDILTMINFMRMRTGPIMQELEEWKTNVVANLDAREKAAATKETVLAAREKAVVTREESLAKSLTESRANGSKNNRTQLSVGNSAENLERLD